MRDDIAAQIWTKDTLKLADILGAENLRAVGGCVRDALTGRPINDIDFATTHTPKEVTALLENDGIKVKPTGVAHGTVTVIYNGKTYEVTSLREDVETHGRRAVVKFTTDWAIDAQRRDFTINAFYLGPDGTLYDGSGLGFADLEAGRLRFIGDAATRIQEDYLRILRLFRFAALTGFAPDEAALAACAQEKEGIKKLSAERVTMEWDKLLVARGAAEALKMMQAAGFGELYNFRPDASEALQSLQGYLTGREVLAYALVFKSGVMDHFVFSRVRQTRMAVLHAIRDSDMSWQECAYRYGHDSALDLYLWRCSVGKAALSPRILAEIEQYDIPVCPIQASDYISQGFSGPALGQKLKIDTENWINTYFE